MMIIFLTSKVWAIHIGTFRFLHTILLVDALSSRTIQEMAASTILSLSCRSILCHTSLFSR